MCVIHSIIWGQLFLMTMMHILVIAVHRYLLVIHQHFSERITNKRTIAILICALHIVSFVLLCGRLNPNNQERFIILLGNCIGKQPGFINLIIVSTVFSLVLAILLLSYGRIYYKVYSSSKQLQLSSAGGTDYANQQRRLQKVKQHRKILQCILTIVGVLPAGLSAWMVNRDGDISPATLSVLMVITWTTNSINSLVYGILDTQFKNGYKRLVSRNSTIESYFNVNLLRLLVRNLVLSGHNPAL